MLINCSSIYAVSFSGPTSRILKQRHCSLGIHSFFRGADVPLVGLNRFLPGNFQRCLGFQVEVGEVCLDLLDFLPRWDQLDERYEHEDAHELEDVALVEVLEVVGGDVEEELVVEDSHHFWHKHEATVDHARAEGEYCSLDVSR